MSALTFGIGAIAVTAAITGIAAAYEAFKGEATEFADGGIVYGKTNAIVGEYQGAENNPEVIAPLSDLQGMIDKNRVVVNNEGSQEMLSKFDALIARVDKMTSGIDGLNRKDITVKAIRPPVVPSGTSRIRICINARHTMEDVKNLIREIKAWNKKLV